MSPRFWEDMPSPTALSEAANSLADSIINMDHDFSVKISETTAMVLVGVLSALTGEHPDYDNV